MDIVTILLWEPTCECGICERVGPWRHAVGWYCGPVDQDPGELVPGWGPDAIAGGRTVCRECHDRFYFQKRPIRLGASVFANAGGEERQG